VPFAIAYKTEFGESFSFSYPLFYSERKPGLNQTFSSQSQKQLWFSNLSLPKEAVYVGIGLLVLFLIILFIINRPRKSKLDQEIDEIKKKQQL
jgi:hypothetical protein